ncbi:uncharacterized protein [Parasteatoda tepidariorum]|uniref:uncharacterized protein n=1 Tax=Parasteatoda tepidariorum TaxID=114398 RepID=UPI001C727785|nr:cilia- and flagella-associated protein 20-like [Parasteatoda tepidariorum]
MAHIYCSTHLEWRKRKHVPLKRSTTLRNTLQRGVVTLFSSHGSEPLKFWSITPGNGSIQRVRSPDIEGLVLDITSESFCQTYIAAPEDTRLKLGCTLSVLSIIMEYLNLPFCFEFQLKDSKNMKRRYRVSTSRSKNMLLNSLLCHLPLQLDVSWNKIVVDLRLLTKLTYGSDYRELLGLQIYANCRLRNVYVSDRKYSEDELPKEYVMKEPRLRHQREFKTRLTMDHLYPSY